MGKMLYEAAFQGEGSMNALLKQFIWLSGQIKEKKNEERIQLRNVIGKKNLGKHCPPLTRHFTIFVWTLWLSPT